MAKLFTDKQHDWAQIRAEWKWMSKKVGGGRRMPGSGGEATPLMKLSAAVEAVCRLAR